MAVNVSRRTTVNHTSRLDMLRLPVLGRLLRWRWGRLAMQIPLIALAVLLIVDGLWGNQLASRNTATIGAWVHYRGLVVLALLLAGNLFCMACPFTLPRTLAKRWSSSGRRWPRVLRNKWLAISGLFVFFFLYEWLDLWASPWLTAWVIVTYFAASFTLELFFKESPFCKYVCPLGTFNLVYATASPSQIGVRDHDICATCVGKECVNGSYSPQPIMLVDRYDPAGRPAATHEHNARGTLGCGTLLFPPQMQSNLDCVFCLDCARACPHDNIGLFLRMPGRELANPHAWRKRWDVALLVIALAFMGITNAFGMVPPVYRLIDALAEGLRPLLALGFAPQAIEGVVLLLIFGVGNLLLPAGVALGAGWLTQRVTSSAGRLSLREIVAAFAPAFVPVGLGIWTAHYLFHFLTGIGAIVPALQEFFGFVPSYAFMGAPLDSPWLGLIELVALLGGFIASAVLAQRTALRLFRRQGTQAFAVWLMVFVALLAAALWLMDQPMEMRGVELFS
ncbi:MAG: hypothetical protein MI924_36185 [Chloroflexales bacterium]|nr:hypothetical protein [Chloroflexales bacterium]